MTIRLRQAVMVAADLDPVVEALCAEFDLTVCYRDPGVATFGLRNALMAVGDTFLEVVAPTRPDTAAGRYLTRRGGDGGYMVILQVDDLARYRAHVASVGVRIVWEGAGAGIAGTHLHPADVGGAILSLDQAEPPDSWGWAGPDWREASKSDVVETIAGIELQSDSPEALADRWAMVLDLPSPPSSDPVSCIELTEGYIGFRRARDQRGEGLAAIDLAATDPSRVGREVSIGGVCVRLVQPRKESS